MTIDCQLAAKSVANAKKYIGFHTSKKTIDYNRDALFC